jgi:hypothetical protein
VIQRRTQMPDVLETELYTERFEREKPFEQGDRNPDAVLILRRPRGAHSRKLLLCGR